MIKKCEMCGKKIDIEAFLHEKTICQKCFIRYKPKRRNAERGVKASTTMIFNKQLNSWMYK